MSPAITDQPSSFQSVIMFYYSLTLSSLAVFIASTLCGLVFLLFSRSVWFSLGLATYWGGAVRGLDNGFMTIISFAMVFGLYHKTVGEDRTVEVQKHVHNRRLAILWIAAVVSALLVGAGSEIIRSIEYHSTNCHDDGSSWLECVANALWILHLCLFTWIFVPRHFNAVVPFAGCGAKIVSAQLYEAGEIQDSNEEFHFRSSVSASYFPQFKWTLRSRMGKLTYLLIITRICTFMLSRLFLADWIDSLLLIFLIPAFCFALQDTKKRLRYDTGYILFYSIGQFSVQMLSVTLFEIMSAISADYQVVALLLYCLIYTICFRVARMFILVMSDSEICTIFLFVFQNFDDLFISILFLNTIQIDSVFVALFVIQFLRSVFRDAGFIEDLRYQLLELWNSYSNNIYTSPYVDADSTADLRARVLSNQIRVWVQSEVSESAALMFVAALLTADSQLNIFGSTPFLQKGVGAEMELIVPVIITGKLAAGAIVNYIFRRKCARLKQKTGRDVDVTKVCIEHLNKHIWFMILVSLYSAKVVVLELSPVFYKDLRQFSDQLSPPVCF
eukprot:GILK01010544.1.p1 GENE.GILK01010544.1~~GILK01010544.1.p1  ORF type:complete len:592 (-),score=39.35 GILK01010544.1:34-1707(-)